MAKYLFLALTPIGQICYIISATRLFGRRGAIKHLLKPRWAIPLANLLVKRIDDYFLCTSLLTKMRFYTPDIDGVYGYFHIYIYSDYETFLKPQGLVIDVGSHIVLFAIKCAKHYRSPSVVAIEPCSSNLRFLRANISMSGTSDRVIIVDAAAGAANGKTRFWLSGRSAQHSLLPSKGKKVTNDVNVVTIDKLVMSFNLHNVNYIKIDVEGAEVDVVKGARETMRQFKPILVVESAKSRLPRLFNLLKPHGYSFYVVSYGSYGNVHVTGTVK